MEEKNATDPVWGKMGEWANYKTEWDQSCKAEKKVIDPVYLDSHSLYGPLRGILVFYINVGQLPPEKAEAFVGRMKKQFEDTGRIERIQKNYEMFWVPVREGHTRVEYIPLQG